MTGGVWSIDQVNSSGVASVLPASSVARTWKMWSPSARSVSSSGESQASHMPSSSLHSKVEFASLEENVKVASSDPVGSSGPSSIVVSGAVRSTVHSAVNGPALFIASSIA